MGNKLIAVGFAVLIVFSTLLATSMAMDFPGVGVLNIKETDTSTEYSPLDNPYEYPITRPLYIYTDGVPPEDSSLYKWLEYVYSEDGQQYVKSAGFYAVDNEMNEKMMSQLHNPETNDRYRNGAITQSGSTTLGDLASLWANDFQKEEGIKVLLTTPGSGTGITNLINGFVDAAQSSREIKESELQNAKENGVDVVEWVVAYDALAIIVHRDNTVRNLSVEDLKNIYTGKYTNWAQLGGEDRSIVLYGRDSASGSYDYFREFILDGENYAAAMQQFSSNALIVAEVENNRGGIGYVGVGYAEEALADEWIEG
ncbi:substrate-binding domain-containing protein [Candidatus Methanomassiliicoccus intestinalis]|uniref:substrate-binding domain-containing protein n=1 Tax=Candidatus Methanomassiliicoccus intestinalis TaxID=1406512 RepID=UPI0037DCC0B0